MPAGIPDGDQPEELVRPEDTKRSDRSNRLPEGNSDDLEQLRTELFDARVTADARKQALSEMRKFYQAQDAEMRKHHTNEIKQLTQRAVTAENELKLLQERNL